MILNQAIKAGNVRINDYNKILTNDSPASTLNLNKNILKWNNSQIIIIFKKWILKLYSFESANAIMATGKALMRTAACF